MKYLVETNLLNSTEKDFNSVYTDEVRRGILAYANGERNATPQTEQKYVLDKFKESVAELPDEITVLEKYDVSAYLKNGYRQIHVDCKTGSDSNSGEENAPFASIEKALDSARAGTPTAVVIHAGSYVISDTLKITQKLTGTPDAPFILASAKDGEVNISASKEIKYSDFSPVDDSDEIALRIPAHVRDKILCADVKALGWTEEDIGIVDKTHLPLLYVNGKIQDMARYPNNSENQYNLLFFEQVDESGSVVDQNGSRLYASWRERVKFYVNYRNYKNGKGEKPDWNIIYTYQGKPKSLYESEAQALADYEKLAAREAEGFVPFVDRFGNWNMDFGFTIRLTPNYQEKADTHVTDENIADLARWRSVEDRNVMMFGNAYEGWDYNRYKIRSIEQKDGYYALTTAGGSSWGAGASGNSPTGHNTFYIYNAPEALDVSGEWYMDTPTGKLYIYPTEDMENAKIEYSAKLCDLLSIEASNVIIDGIHFDKGSRMGIYAQYAEGVVIQNCNLTNMGNAAIELRECRCSAVIYNEFKYNRSLSVKAMSQELLCRGIPSLNVIQNNHVDHPINTQAGINVGGWRNCISHNVLDLSQITLGGLAALENIIEYNDIRGGHTDTSDAGLIYMNQFAARGSHIRYNYLHNWRAPGNGIYLDDLNSGNYIYCNIIDTTEAPGKKPRGFVYTSTGHDHVIYNNFCIGRAHIIQQTLDEKYHVLSFKTKMGVIYSSIGEATPDGKYPLTITVNGSSYTALADMTDNKTSKTYKAVCEYEGYKSLELWCVKTESDSEGDSASVVFENFDGTYLRLANYNDRINQSWLYYADSCWLGYRFPGFVKQYLKNYYFTKSQEVYKKRFPELYTYLGMYEKWSEDRLKEGYRPRPLQMFLRSAAMNIVDNNVILGVPRAMEYGFPSVSENGLDAEGNETVFYAQNTNTFRGNYDNTSDTYETLKPMIVEYQDKDNPCSFDFRTLMERAEAEQIKQNPEYKPLSYLLDRVGKTK